MVTPNLSPILRQQRDAAFNYATGTAQNAYDKGFFQQRGQRNMDEFSKGFGRELPSFTARQTQRGLGGGGVQSGVMNRAMRNYVGDYTGQLGQMQQDYNAGVANFDSQQAMMTDYYQKTMDDLELQKAQEIANTADGLLQLQQLYGGGY
jgi:hypothetical protein